MSLDQRLDDSLRRDLNSLEDVGSWVKALFTAESASLKEHYGTQAWALRPAAGMIAWKSIVASLMPDSLLLRILGDIIGRRLALQLHGIAAPKVLKRFLALSSYETIQIES